jgi:hypothetical protein
MKAVIAEVARRIPLAIETIDVDPSAELCEKFGGEVPVLFVDGRKAFKYRVGVKELERYLRQGPRLGRGRFHFGSSKG